MLLRSLCPIRPSDAIAGALPFDRLVALFLLRSLCLTALAGTKVCIDVVACECGISGAICEASARGQ